MFCTNLMLVVVIAFLFSCASEYSMGKYNHGKIIMGKLALGRFCVATLINSVDINNHVHQTSFFGKPLYIYVCTLQISA